MKRTSRLAALSLVVGTALTAAPAQASVVGYGEGCTPGYWKQAQHMDSWEESEPDTLLSAVFSASGGYGVGERTLLESLAGGGGGGAEGAATILARAAVAAWLNAENDGISYPWRRDLVGMDDRPALRQAVNAAFASGDRGTMLELAAWLDADNNAGCPLS